eukprot:2148218-Prymnesium_polylepis.1
MLARYQPSHPNLRPLLGGLGSENTVVSIKSNMSSRAGGVVDKRAEKPGLLAQVNLQWFRRGASSSSTRRGTLLSLIHI